MSKIRKHSILSSLVIYAGFAVGLLNTYFFGKEGLFTQEQYGLTGIFIAVGTMMMGFAMLGIPSYLSKFFPYYKDHVREEKNDMFTWSLLGVLLGFALVMLTGILLKEVVIRKFSEHSLLMVKYYYWIFPMGLGLALFNLLETYAWNFHQSVFTNYLREVQWRLYITVLIALFISGIVRDFDLFIKLYSLSYLFIALTLLITLIATKKIHFTFKPSKVTRRYLKLILKLCSFVYAANLIVIVSQVFDSIVLASLNGLDKAGIFALATLMGSVIQAPQRGIVAASVSHLSRAWKDKDMALLQRVYQRSSINMLIFACGLFVLIALNYQEAIITFKLKPSFLLGFNAFILIGITRIIDMGTGVNAQIITTSTWWKFELISGLILLTFMLPLTYFLTKEYGIIGPAIASLVAVSFYNLVRIIFLWKKFRLFPFTHHSLYALVVATICAIASYLLFMGMHGFAGLVARSIAFVLLYGAGVWKLNLSPDLQPVLASLAKRLTKKTD